VRQVGYLQGWVFVSPPKRLSVSQGGVCSENFVIIWLNLSVLRKLAEWCWDLKAALFSNRTQTHLVMFTQLKENVLIHLVEVHVCRLLSITARSIYTFCSSYRASDMGRD
jgi:hypothetical protein